MRDDAKIDRRKLLASSGAALSFAMTQRAVAQTTGSDATSRATGSIGGFEPVEVETPDNTVFARRYGKGSPVLLIHGFPRTSLMWRFVAPKLANDHTVICVDLR